MGDPASASRAIPTGLNRYYPIDGRREQDGCPSLRLLLPLAEQIIADLGPSA